MDVRKLFLETEGDNYYHRNKENLENEVGYDVSFYTEFLLNHTFDEKIKIIEIGAANGRNLNYFKKKY